MEFKWEGLSVGQLTLLDRLAFWMHAKMSSCMILIFLSSDHHTIPLNQWKIVRKQSREVYNM